MFTNSGSGPKTTWKRAGATSRLLLLHHADDLRVGVLALGDQLSVRPEDLEVGNRIELELGRDRRVPVYALDSRPVYVHLDDRDGP